MTERKFTDVEIYKLLITHGAMLRKDISRLLGISEITHALRTLLAKGLIEKVKITRGMSFYRVKGDNRYYGILKTAHDLMLCGLCKIAESAKGHSYFVTPGKVAKAVCGSAYISIPSYNAIYSYFLKELLGCTMCTVSVEKIRSVCERKAKSLNKCDFSLCHVHNRS
jgi:DNA-binding transcriptional ArsR family regulator